MSCKTGMEKLRVCLQTIFKNNFITQKRCLTNFWLNNNFLKFVLKKRCFLEEIWDIFNCFLQSVLSNNWKYKKYIGNYCIVHKCTVVPTFKNKLRKLFFISEFPNPPIMSHQPIHGPKRDNLFKGDEPQHGLMPTFKKIHVKPIRTLVMKFKC